MILFVAKNQHGCSSLFTVGNVLIANLIQKTSFHLRSKFIRNVGTQVGSPIKVGNEQSLENNQSPTLLELQLSHSAKKYP